MKIEADKPLGCRAEAIGIMVATSRHEDNGNVVLICGDRRTDLALSRNDTNGIKYEHCSYERKQLTKVVSEVMCGFCVSCPNRLVAVPDLPG